MLSKPWNPRWVAVLTASLLCIWPGLSQADGGIVKGQVRYVRTHNANQHPGWAPPRFWFALKDVAAAAQCPTWYGNVLFVGDDVQMFAMVMKAQASGGEVAVAYEDSQKESGYCVATFVTTGSPPPLQ